MGRREFKNSINSVKPNPVGTDTNTEVKKFKMEVMNLSAHNGNTASTGLTIDVKNELQPPGLNFNSQSSRSCPLTEEEI